MVSSSFPGRQVGITQPGVGWSLDVTFHGVSIVRNSQIMQEAALHNPITLQLGSIDAMIDWRAFESLVQGCQNVDQEVVAIGRVMASPRYLNGMLSRLWPYLASVAGIH